MAALCYSKASGNLAPPVLSFLPDGAILGNNPPPITTTTTTPAHKHFKMDAKQTPLLAAVIYCCVVSSNVLWYVGGGLSTEPQSLLGISKYVSVALKSVNTTSFRSDW